MAVSILELVSLAKFSPCNVFITMLKTSSSSNSIIIIKLLFEMALFVLTATPTEVLFFSFFFFFKKIRITTQRRTLIMPSEMINYTEFILRRISSSRITSTYALITALESVFFIATC
jgi:hypothetical protein